MDGSHLVMQDIDSAPGFTTGEAVTVTWNNIPLDGAACVTFSGLFAGAKGVIDNTDYIHVDYSKDIEGTWVPLLHFEGADLSLGQFSGVFRLDRDLDGDGDLTERALNDTAWLYSAVSQPLNGAPTLALRLSVSLDSADESVGLDTFRLVASSCTAPSTPAETFTTPVTPRLSTSTVASTSVNLETTSRVPVMLSLPFMEDFNSSAQMTLSHGFSSDGIIDYFGIENGNNSDFGIGSAPPLLYEGEASLLSRQQARSCDAWQAWTEATL